MADTNIYPLPRILRAGPVSAEYRDGDLRMIRYNGEEVVRRIYGAIRGEQWQTVAGVRTNEKIEETDGGFHVSYTSRHTDGPIDFEWRATITGEKDGTITFTFDGAPLSRFSRNRIGLCVLHPSHLGGRECLVRHNDGSEEAGFFPLSIEPHQPFFDVAALLCPVPYGALFCETKFAGEVFEMEDQRNWLDASFKTYSTPQERPKPVTVEPGEKIWQSVSVRFHREAGYTSAYLHGLDSFLPKAMPPVLLALPQDFSPPPPPNFTEWNRRRSAPGEAVRFAGSPQVHAFDDMSILETPPTLRLAVQSAIQIAGMDAPIEVGPLTLYSSRHAEDARQKTLFGAAWYAGAAMEAAIGGANRIFLCEETGPRGVRDGDGKPYPVAFVVEWLQDKAGADICDLWGSEAADEAEKTLTLAVRQDDMVHLLLVNCRLLPVLLHLNTDGAALEDLSPVTLLTEEGWTGAPPQCFNGDSDIVTLLPPAGVATVSFRLATDEGEGNAANTQTGEGE